MLSEKPIHKQCTLQHSAAIYTTITFLQRGTVQNYVNILCKMSRRFLGQSTLNMFQVIILIFLHFQRDHWCKLGWIHLFFLQNMVPLKPVYKPCSVLNHHLDQTSPVSQVIPVCAPDWRSSSIVCFNEKRENMLYIFLMFKSLYNMQVLPCSECDFAAPLWVTLVLLEAVNGGEKQDYSVRDNGFSVVRWTGTFTLMFFVFWSGWLLSFWHDFIERVVPKMQQRLFLLLMCSFVTHCTDACLRWRCCEPRNCHPRPRLPRRLLMKLPPMVSYCTVQSHVWKQRFLVRCGWWL